MTRTFETSHVFRNADDFADAMSVIVTDPAGLANPRWVTVEEDFTCKLKRAP